MTEVQKRILEIYKCVAKICEKNNLRYFAIGGTCIGAVREAGFIPWDDDMDIAMPRCDYEILREKCRTELPEHLKVFDYESSRYWVNPFFKVHDTRTTYIEESCKEFSSRHTGIWLDIFPIDGLPKNAAQKNLVIKKLRILTWLNFFLRRIPAYSKKRTLVRLAKNFIKTVLGVLLDHLYPFDFYSKKIDALLLQNDFDSSSEVLFSWMIMWGDDGSRAVFKKEYFSNALEMPFEDVKMKIPIGYDAHLKQIFGDYMTPPPKEEQVSNHEIAICDVEKPYTEYRKILGGGYNQLIVDKGKLKILRPLFFEKLAA